MILIKWFGTPFTGDNAGKKRELSDDEQAPEDLTPLRNKVNVFLFLSFFVTLFFNCPYLCFKNAIATFRFNIFLYTGRSLGSPQRRENATLVKRVRPPVTLMIQTPRPLYPSTTLQQTIPHSLVSVFSLLF